MQDLLWNRYLPVKRCVSSMSVHSLRVSVSHFRLLKWETFTFISSGLCLQHPDLSPMNYKIFIKSRSGSFSEKFILNWPTLWYDWHSFEQRIIDNAPDEWCKRLWVCVFMYKDYTFLIFNLTIVWWKLQVSWCYCVQYIIFYHFFIFFLHFSDFTR